LISAALETVAAGEEVSLRAVSRRVGASAAAAYHHFPSKDHLLAAIALDGFVALGEELARARGDDAVVLLADMARRYVRFAVGRPAHYRTMFTPSLNAHASLQAVALARFGELAAAVARVRASRGLSTEDAPQRASLAWALAHGLALLTIDGVWQGLPAAAAALLPARAALISGDVGEAVVAIAIGLDAPPTSPTAVEDADPMTASRR
jgi:AcrR family transcriptional regulator